MLTGSCLCGSVAYEVDADPGPSLPLPHLPQDTWIGVFDRNQRPPRPLSLDQGRRPDQRF